MNILKNDSKGQGLVEYGLILALVSVFAVGSLRGVGNKVTSTFSLINEVDVDRKISEGYIPIATAEELNSLRKDDVQIFGANTKWEKEYDAGLDKKYVQVSDIDLSNFSNWEPIGNWGNHFSGIFDGNGYTIEHLKVDRPLEQGVGLFGYVVGGTIKNIILNNLHVDSHQDVGGLVGQLVDSEVSNGRIQGVSKVIGTKNSIGGLVGYSKNSTISDSDTNVKVSGVGSVGGLVGNSHWTTITKSFSLGTVTGSTDSNMNIGGLVGHLYYSSSVADSYARVKVEGREHVGGLVGVNGEGSTIKNSYAQSEVSGAINAGGLVGYIYKSSVRDSGWDILHHAIGVGKENIASISNVIGYSSEDIEGFINGLIN